MTQTNAGAAVLALGLALYTGAAAATDEAVDPMGPGIALFQEGRMEEAGAFFRARAEADPEDAVAAYWLGRVAYEQGALDVAAEWLRRAAAATPPRPEVHLWLGRTYREQFQDAGMLRALRLARRSREAYEEAVRLDPEGMEARAELALLYLSLPGMAGGDEAKGLELVEWIESRDPPRAHVIRGRYHIQNERYASAVAELRAAVEADPEGVEARYLLGRAHLRAEDYPQAIAAFERLVEIGPGAFPAGSDEHGWFVEAHYQVGLCVALSGLRPDLGIERLTRFLELAGGREEVTGPGTAHYRRAQIFEQRGDRDAARRDYEAALRLRPKLKAAKRALRRLDE